METLVSIAEQIEQHLNNKNYREVNELQLNFIRLINIQILNNEF